MADNIHVAIRVRPLIKRELENKDPIVWSTKGSCVIYQKNCPTTEYPFDRVFNSNEGNAFIYRDLCAPIVQSVMEGFNGTIFAYGQTSSGKTYTMTGEYGIIPCAVRDIFDTIDSMPEREFLLRVSYMEIYNECIIDLMTEGTKDLKPTEDVDGVISVLGLSEKEIKTSDQVFEIMKRCEKRRRIGDTQMNDKSSRSHAIFRMIIESRMRHAEDSVVNVGQLNLVDLAGSERPGQMGTRGDRYTEGVNINKSLSNLTKVISQLSTMKNDRQHISYRDSKLTRILQNSLGGNARTVVICTVTPVSYQETLSTLNFASNAKRIRNKPKANVVSNEKALLKRYANEIKSLSEKLEALQQLGDSGKKEILEKELEEKSKQNENLKRQIEELKEKFVVSQFPPNSPQVLNLKSRRETWCPGLFAGRKSVQSEFKQGLLNPLPILKEEMINLSPFSEFVDIKPRRGLSTFDIPSFDKISVSIQTESIEDKEIEALQKTLTTKIKEYEELKEFTTSEKQMLEISNFEASRVMVEDLEAKLINFDTLAQENSNLKEKVKEMIQQIEMLASQNSELKSQCQELEEQGCLISPEFRKFNFNPKLNLCEELKMFEKEEQMDTKDNYLETDMALSTSVAETSPQLKKVCDKSVQAENFVDMRNEFHTLDQDCKNTTKYFSGKLAFCEGCSKKLTDSSNVVIDVSHIQSMLLECEKQTNNSLNEVLCTYQSISDRVESQILKPVTSALNSLEELDIEESNYQELDLELTDIVNKHISSQYEREIETLKQEIKFLKEDNEHQLKNINYLEDVHAKKNVHVDELLDNCAKLKEKVDLKENELLTWRQNLSEQCDKNLIILKEKIALQKQMKNIEDVLIQKEKLIKELMENVEKNKADLTYQKEELHESLKAHALMKEKFDIAEKDHFEELEKYKQENNKISLLKSQIETQKMEFCKAIENLKSNHAERIVNLERQLKMTFDNKISILKMDLNRQHSLTEEIDKLQIQLTAQASNFKLEKVRFEESIVKENRAFLSQLKNALEVKDKECEKLKVLVEQTSRGTSNNGKDGAVVARYKKLLALNQKELHSHQSILENTQSKLELSEKKLEEMEAAKKDNLEAIKDLENKKSYLESLLKERDGIIKEHSTKFSAFKSDFEREYKKLKTENDAMKRLGKMEEKLSLKNSASAEKSQHGNIFTNDKEKDAASSTAEKNLELLEIQTKFAKYKEENAKLVQKLSLCKNEIRHLHELQNESKVAKDKGTMNTELTTTINASSVNELQSTLRKKEEYINVLEREVRKYKTYLKSKGHHRVVDDTKEKSDGKNDKQDNNTQENTVPKIHQNMPSTGHDAKMNFETPFQKDTAVGSKPHGDLKYDDQNCKQQ